MPLLIEDGTNVAGATSYATRVEIIAYAAARGVTIADEDATDVFAVKAMDYLERQRFKGERVNDVYDGQPLEWPRKCVGIGLFQLPIDVIPHGLINAQCEAAMLISQGIDLEPNRAAEQHVKSEKVGPLETEYFGAPLIKATTPQLDALLRPLVVGSGFAVNVIRA